MTSELFNSRIKIRNFYMYMYMYISYFDDRYRPTPSIYWHNKLVLNYGYIFCHWMKITTILRHVGSKHAQLLIINIHEQYRKNCMHCTKNLDAKWTLHQTSSFNHHASYAFYVRNIRNSIMCHVIFYFLYLHRPS